MIAYSKAPAPLSQQALEFLAEFEYFVKASRVLDEEDRPSLRKLCQIIKHVVKGGSEKMIVKYAQDALLRCYQNDGTTERTTVRTTEKLPDKPTVQRKGKALTEYVAERTYLVGPEEGAERRRTMHAGPVREPQPLREGKNSWAFVEATRTSQDPLFAQGHDGIGVHFFCFDGALFDQLVSLFTCADPSSSSYAVWTSKVYGVFFPKRNLLASSKLLASSSHALQRSAPGKRFTASKAGLTKETPFCNAIKRTVVDARARMWFRVTSPGCADGSTHPAHHPPYTPHHSFVFPMYPLRYKCPT